MEYWLYFYQKEKEYLSQLGGVYCLFTFHFSQLQNVSFVSVVYKSSNHPHLVDIKLIHSTYLILLFPISSSFYFFLSYGSFDCFLGFIVFGFIVLLLLSFWQLFLLLIDYKIQIKNNEQQRYVIGDLDSSFVT